MLNWSLILNNFSIKFRIVSNFLKNKNLNYEKAQSLVNNTLVDCDDGELYLEDTKSESILLDDNKIKSSSFKRDTGYGLRGVT